MRIAGRSGPTHENKYAVFANEVKQSSDISLNKQH